MIPSTNQPGRMPATRRTRAGRKGALALAVALLLGGCGVRLETPPPGEPAPDAVEVVRRTAVADALLVSQQADAAALVAGTAPEVVAELTQISDFSDAQVAQLGGEYDSGLSDVLGDGTPTPSASAPAVAAPADVVVSLMDAAGRSRSAADTTADGPLARLLASIAASQTLSASRLAGLTGTEGPAPADPVIPVPPEVDEPTADATEPEAAASDAASGEPTPADVAPGGLSAEQLSGIVLAEDTAGYALELRAALADGALRDMAVARAAVHRARAEAWAELAGTAGTDQDPRRVAYVVPGAEVTTEALAQQLEDGLASGYATLVGVAEPGTRRVLITLLAEATTAGTTWGTPLTAFPGLPEQVTPAA
ncbi:DUF4439 domain-containing protein [Antribacter soli]|nr:DUF4439 domain-containing protein [Antribacter soli]